MRKLTASIGVAMLCFGLAGTAAAATYSFSYPTAMGITEGDYVYADIAVAGISGNIADVNVFVDIDHTWIGDLDIYIAHQEAGRSSWKYVQLYNEDGDYRNDMTNVLFDQDASMYINEAAPPYGPGSFKPTANPESGESNLLTDYNGDLAAGIWSLVLYDNATGDLGTLQGFRVDIETSAVPLPGAVVLLGSGLSALAALRRKRRI